MPAKTFLRLELGTDPQTCTTALQTIKDAMAAAIMHRVDNTGTVDNTDPLYQVYQSIYLQAHCQLRQHIVAAPEG